MFVYKWINRVEEWKKKIKHAAYKKKQTNHNNCYKSNAGNNTVSLTFVSMAFVNFFCFYQF